MIGFDRSAFVAGLQSRLGNQKGESCSSAIHDEGLPEHPIKNSNQTSLHSSVVLITKTNLSKALREGASLNELYGRAIAAGLR